MTTLAVIPESQIIEEITYPFIYVPHLEGAGTTIHDRAGLLPDKTLEGTTTYRTVSNQPTNVTGVRVMFASAGSAIGDGTLTYVNATDSLSWAESGDTAGSPVVLTVDGVVELLSNNGQKIAVSVDYSALPGSDQNDANITVDNATSNHWSELHNGLKNSGDNYVLYNGDGESVIVDPTVGNKRLLISFWALSGQANDIAEYIIAAGPLDNGGEANGAWAVRFQGGSSRITFGWRWKGTASDTSLFPAETQPYGVLNHYLFDIALDGDGDVGGSVYVNGALKNTVVFSTTGKENGFPEPDRLVLGGMWKSDTNTYIKHINGALTPSNCRYHSMFIGRPPVVADGGKTGLTIAADLYKRKGGLSRELIA